jgi:hypothetical protein
MRGTPSNGETHTAIMKQAQTLRTMTQSNDDGDDDDDDDADIWCLLSKSETTCMMNLEANAGDPKKLST